MYEFCFCWCTLAEQPQKSINGSFCNSIKDQGILAILEMITIIIIIGLNRLIIYKFFQAEKPPSILAIGRKSQNFYDSFSPPSVWLSLCVLSIRGKKLSDRLQDSSSTPECQYGCRVEACYEARHWGTIIGRRTHNQSRSIGSIPSTLVGEACHKDDRIDRRLCKP